MSFPVGLALRLLGPLIEVICLVALRKWGGQERTVAGLPIEYLFDGGLVVGLAMVVLGLTWFRTKPGAAGDRR